jgi:hypothetical protein
MLEESAHPDFLLLDAASPFPVIPPLVRPGRAVKIACLARLVALR